MGDWDPEVALASLAEDSSLLDDGDTLSTARRVFRENAGVAAAAIVHIAKYSVSDRTRLEAARYVVERNLGRVGEDETIDDPLEKLLGTVVKEEEDNIVRARSYLN